MSFKKKKSSKHFCPSDSLFHKHIFLLKQDLGLYLKYPVVPL